MHKKVQSETKLRDVPLSRCLMGQTHPRTGISLMKRLCAIFHEHAEALYTVDVLCKNISPFVDHLDRATLRRYLLRLQGHGIVEILRGDAHQKLYRCRSKTLARSYLEGHSQDYAGRMAPRSPPERPPSTVFHRPVYRVMLSPGELARVHQVGARKKIGRTPEYAHVVSDGFRLKAWNSGKAQVFLADDWRGPMKAMIGDSLVLKVEAEVSGRNGHEGVARPPPMPVGQVFRVREPDGSTTVLQYGTSQIAEGELDRHGKQDAPNGNLVETWLYDETRFKVDVANGFQSIDSRFAQLHEHLDRMPQAIGEAVKKALDELLTGTKEQYEKKEPAKDEFMYG